MTFPIKVDIFTYGDKVLLPTTTNFDNGFFLMQEPVTVLPVCHRASIIAAIASMLAVENPRIPVKPRPELFKNFIYQHVGVRSHKKFMEKAQYWRITRSESGVRFSPFHVDGRHFKGCPDDIIV